MYLNTQTDTQTQGSTHMQIELAMKMFYASCVLRCVKTKCVLMFSFFPLKKIMYFNTAINCSDTRQVVNFNALYLVVNSF